jgi:putative acetyltransferase
MSIVIRHAEPGDFEAVQSIFEAPEAIAGTRQVPFPTAEAWRKLLAEQQPGGKILPATIDGRVVGEIGIHTVPRQGVGSALLQAAISLADNWLHLLRLELTVYTDNEVAVRLYKKHGFFIEGTHRAYALRDGKYVDAYAMARIHPNPPNIALHRPTSDGR